MNIDDELEKAIQQKEQGSVPDETLPHPNEISDCLLG